MSRVTCPPSTIVCQVDTSSDPIGWHSCAVVTPDAADTPAAKDLFAASRELIGEDEAEATRHKEVQAARSADSGRALVGPGSIIGRSWPMPRQFTRLFGLLCGVFALLLLAVAYSGWVWAVFGAGAGLAVGLGVRVMQSNVLFEAHAIRLQGVLRTTVFGAEQIRDVEVAEDTPATLQARVGPIPRVQTCRLVLTNGRRVPVSTATVAMRTALANLEDTELSQLRDVVEAWLAEVRRGEATASTFKI